MAEAPQTLCELYHEQAHRLQDRVLCYFKDPGGRWEARNWRQSLDEVRAIAGGLMALGVEPGHRVGLISETRPEWTAVDLAVINTGAVTVGIYPTSTDAQCGWVLSHAECAVVVVEDPEQLQKLRDVADQLPQLAHIVLIEGGESLSDGRVLSLQELKDRGERLHAEHPTAYEARWRAVEPDDLAMLVYTSGTTGPPKGVMLSHRNVLATVDSVLRQLPLRDDDLSVIFLPLAHSLQRVAGYAGLRAGTTGVYAERLDKIVDHMQEFRPTVQAAVPRIYEKIHARILARVEEAPPVRRRLFHWAVGVGREVSRLQQAGQPVPRRLAAQHAVADRLVLRRIRDVFGGNVRFMISGAAPIATELLEFFHACGVLILEGYGLTETTAPATVNTAEAFRFGTVGRPLDVCRIRIADDGEILIKGENVFRGYYKDDEATAAAFTPDGWFRTGDVGSLDELGYLRITDRKKELIVTAGGKNISPANIENLVKTERLISQCVVHGDRRKFLVALITIDCDEAARVADQLGVAVRDPVKLARHPRIQAEVQLAIDRANRQVARYETIKYFRVLDHELTVEDDLLTPTLKLKRRNIEARYQHLLDEMYDTPRRLRRG